MGVISEQLNDTNNTSSIHDKPTTNTLSSSEFVPRSSGEHWMSQQLEKAGTKVKQDYRQLEGQYDKVVSIGLNMSVQKTTTPT